MRQAGDRITRPGSPERRAQRRPAPRRRAQTPSPAFGPLTGPDFQGAQRQAAQRRERAATRVGGPPLPSFPLLKQYTKQQRQTIIRAHARVINQHRQEGESANDALRRLRANGDAQTKQRIRVLDRALGQEVPAKRARQVAQRKAAGPTVRSGPKPKHTVLGAGIAPLATATNFLLSPEHNAIAAMHPGKIASTYGGRIVGDTISLARNAPLSFYLMGRAGVKAAQGDTGPAGELWHQFKQHDPLALAAQGKFKRAIIEAGNHPVNTALELGGLRAGGGTLAKITRTDLRREARTLPGTAIVEPQRAGHPLSKLAMDRLDARRQRRYDEHTQRGRALEAQGHYDAAAEEFRKAGRPPTMVSDRYLEHRGDIAEHMGQPARRRGRAEVAQAYRGRRAVRRSQRREGMLVPVQEGGHVQGEISRGIVPARILKNGRVDVADLRARLKDRADRLAAEQKNLSGWRLNRNRRTVKEIRKALAVSDNQLERIAEQAHASARYTNALEAKAARRGMRDQAEMTKARFKDYAVHNMGARHDYTTEDLAAWQRKWDEQKAAAAREGRQPGPPPPKPAKQFVVDQGDHHRAEIARLKRENEQIGMRIETETARARRANGQGKAREGAAAAQYVRLAEQRIADNSGRIAQLEKAAKGGKKVPLSTDDILADMNHQGFDPTNVSFVTQAPTGLRGAFNTRWYPRKRLGTDRTKTGEATRLGLYDTSPKALHANAGRLQQAISADENFVHQVQQVMVTTEAHPDGVFTTPQAAREAIHAMQFTKDGERIPGIPDMRVIRTVPFGTPKARQNLHYMLEHGDEEGFVTRGGVQHHPISEAIKQAVDENAADGPGPYAIVPAKWAQRIEDHADVYKSSSPTLRALTGMFRHTVLPLSLPWLTGNVAEAGVRAAIQDPRIVKNIRTFQAVHAALKKMDPEEAARLQDMLGTGHFGMSELSHTHTSLEQFSGRRVEPVVRAWAQLRARPGVGTAVDAYQAWTHWVFNSVNNRLEHPFKEAMAGHHMRKVLGPEVEANSAQALADALRGRKGTNAQVRLADDVRRAYGQYEAFSPTFRKYVVLYSPFMAWSVNAVKFLFHVLPKDHPALTAVIAASDRASQQWRKDNGLEEGQPGAVPAFLMGSIPLPGGGHLRVSRYTPWGFFTDPAGSVAGGVLPQFEGALSGLRGQEWTGKPIKGPAGGEATQQQKFLAAGAQLLEAHVPFISLIQGIASKGGSITRPQSIPGALAGYENPFKVTGKARKGGGSSKLPKGYDPNKIDWGKVDWGGGSGKIDWSKVDWGAGK